MTFKNIRIKKKGGGSRLQRVKVLASGKYKFVKNLTKSRSQKVTRRKKSNPNRRTRRMVRRKNRRGGGKSLQTTVFKWLRIAALVGPGAYQAIKWPKLEDKARQVLIRYTGYDMETGQFALKYLAEGYGPFLMTVLATYGIPKIAGIIRKI